MRRILMVLGITIGIAAVICVVAIGKAGQARVEQQLNNLGDNFVWIEAGGRAVNGVRTGTHDTKTLVMADALAIKNQVSLIKSVSPNVDDPVQVVYGNQNWHTAYRGVSPEYFEIKRWYVDQGAIFSQDDVDRAADVCAIGRTVRDQLFGVDDPLGKVIRVSGLPCKVVATLHPKGLAWPIERSIFLCKCRVGSSNALRSRGRWSTIRRFCWPTNPPVISTAERRSKSWRSSRT